MTDKHLRSVVTWNYVHKARLLLLQVQKNADVKKESISYFYSTVLQRLDFTLMIKTYFSLHLGDEFYKIERMIVIDGTLKHVTEEIRENMAALQTQICVEDFAVFPAYLAMSGIVASL